MLKAYIVPHPPIILPEIGRGEELKIAATTAAYQAVADEIAELNPDTIVLSSPHSPLYADGFFVAGGKKGKGDFSAFSAPEVKEEFLLDSELSERLCHISQEKGLVTGLEPQIGGADHGVLVPLHFIRQRYRDFRLLQVGLSGLSAEAHFLFGQCIREALEQLGRRAVFVASGDLSHVLRKDGPYGFRPEGPEFDRQIVELLSRAAFDEVLNMPLVFCEKAAECGLRSFQILAGALDGDEVTAKRLSYEGPFGVGYAVMSFSLNNKADSKANDENRWTQPGCAEGERLSPLPGNAEGEAESALNTDAERERSSTQGDKAEGKEAQNSPKREACAQDITELARKSILYFLEHKALLPLPENLPQNLLTTQAGCFVSLHKGKALRGCIGTMCACQDSLAEEIIYNAVTAANEDPRFPAVRQDEVAVLDISVDVLGELEDISSPAELDPQRYGVYVQRGRRSGVLLPRLEGVETIEEQLDIALAKAGIAAEEDFALSRFEVRRYEENR